MSNAQTTVVGYYNGNRWPIQLVISKLNLTLILQPGEYILDRSKQKINDPFFDTYKQLSREISDTPVGIITIPTQNALPAPTGQATSPVRGTSKFGLDAQGVRRPMLAAAASMPVSEVLSHQHTPAGADPVTPMTMEEARARGLARRVREVPEDYGVTDTTGAPPRTPPTIKYSDDPSMLRKAPPLPPQLTKVDSKEVGNASTRTQLVTQLAKGATKPATPESANAFLNQTLQNGPANPPLTSGTAMPRSVLRSQPPAPLMEAEGEPEISMEMETEPEQSQGEPEIVTEEQSDEPTPGGLPTPDLSELEQEQTSQPPVRPIAKRDRYICAGCSQPFKFRSQLDKHAAARHKPQYAAIMAAYPPEE